MNANEFRAARAKSALTSYDATEMIHDPYSVTTDLLADLMHYCHQSGINFRDSICVAHAHFETEIQEEEE